MMWFIGFVLAFGAILLDGLYFLNAWTWFVVPLGIPAIGYAHALGLQMLLGTMHASSKKIETDVEFVSYILSAAIGNLILFGVMALIHLFM